MKETIANYLQPFVTPEIAQVFCPAANTFDFADIDRGKIICVAMPQKFQTERRYVNTFLKMLFYTHALRRFDKPKEDRQRDNLIVLWADEAQRFVTASEEGMSDYNCVDVIREAQATVVAAAQSSTSFIPPLGREKARVFILNLRNRLIFKAADEEGALESADFIGKAKVIKKSWGYSGGKLSLNYFRDRRASNQAALATHPNETCLCPRPLRKGTSQEVAPTLWSQMDRLSLVSEDLALMVEAKGWVVASLRSMDASISRQSNKTSLVTVTRLTIHLTQTRSAIHLPKYEHLQCEDHE